MAMFIKFEKNDIMDTPNIKMFIKFEENQIWVS